MRRVELAKMARNLMYLSILMPILLFIFYRFPYPECINGLTNVQDIGASADFLAGTITPILTLAAFLLLLESYNLQKEELKLTREELEKSTNELKEQRQIMEAEKILSTEKNEIDIFFALFQNWRNSVKSIKYKSYFLFIYNNRKGEYELKSSVGDNGANNFYYSDINEYGHHLNLILNIVAPMKCFSTIKILHDSKGSIEYNYIMENLKYNSNQLYFGFNNLIKYSDRCGDKNKEIIYEIIQSSLSWSEKFILNMIASDFILGKIEDSDIERKKLKKNLYKLKIEMPNYDKISDEYLSSIKALFGEKSL